MNPEGLTNLEAMLRYIFKGVLRQKVKAWGIRGMELKRVAIFFWGLWAGF